MQFSMRGWPRPIGWVDPIQLWPAENGWFEDFMAAGLGNVCLYILGNLNYGQSSTSH